MRSKLRDLILAKGVSDDERTAADECVQMFHKERPQEHDPHAATRTMIGMFYKHLGQEGAERLARHQLEKGSEPSEASKRALAAVDAAFYVWEHVETAWQKENPTPFGHRFRGV